MADREEPAEASEASGALHHYLESPSIPSPEGESAREQEQQQPSVPDASRVAQAAKQVHKVEVGLETIVQQGRFAKYRTVAALGLLVGVAGLAIGGGIVADNAVFWTGAVSVFFLACAGLVAWAAKTLGVFAEMAQLFRDQLGAARETLAESKETPRAARETLIAESEETTRAAFETLMAEADPERAIKAFLEEREQGRRAAPETPIGESEATARAAPETLKSDLSKQLE